MSALHCRSAKPVRLLSDWLGRRRDRDSKLWPSLRSKRDYKEWSLWGAQPEPDSPSLTTHSWPLNPSISLLWALPLGCFWLSGEPHEKTWPATVCQVSILKVMWPCSAMESMKTRLLIPTPGRQLLLSALVCTAWDYRMGCPVHVRAVILVLESMPITGVSIIANYWIIGSMKFWGEIWHICTLSSLSSTYKYYTHISKCRYNNSALW